MIEPQADTRATVVELIAIELNVSEDLVRKAGSLRHELRMDSIAAANILFSIEEAFGISLEETIVKKLDSVAEVVLLVEKVRSGKGPRRPLR